ncbi:MAG: dihydropyrimidine dehydrogenase, partial [Deferribacteraceae bacterium]|nr:dihydropyrimidine dehydrogenase [Deferribacteraceae bacterium]
MDILHKTPMAKQEPEVRAHNFQEVALGYSVEDMQAEAARCIECKNKPCMKGCPVHIKIPEFIHLLKEGDIKGAYNKIAEDSNLPSICGRVCPQEDQCEKFCIRGIKGEPVSIGALERFVGDWGMANHAA